MAQLPQNTHTTLYAIEQAVRAQASDWRRAHLGASIIGRPCDRELWYAFRWAKAPDHPARLLRLFARGQREEDVFVELLRAAGVTVYTHDEVTGRQFSVSACGGHFGGSMDGAAVGLVESGRWHCLEFKTHGEKSFRELAEVGVEKAKPEHFAQMQVYMRLAGLDRAYYMAVNKNTDELHAERVRYHQATAERLLDRAERVIFAQTPPPRVSDDPSWYECQLCEFHAICHDRQPPLHVSCRTCLHATPEREGVRRWSCARWQAADLSLADQKAGCDEHRLIPALVAYADPVDASESENWVLYRTPGGFEFRNGPRGERSFPSAELAAIPPALMGDERMHAIREQMDGTFAGGEAA